MNSILATQNPCRYKDTNKDLLPTRDFCDLYTIWPKDSKTQSGDTPTKYQLSRISHGVAIWVLS